MITESAYIIHRLLQLGASSDAPSKPDIEFVPSNDSFYWSHWAEGTQMIGLVAERILGATNKGFAAQMPEGEARKAVEQYGQWTAVRQYKVCPTQRR